VWLVIEQHGEGRFEPLDGDGDRDSRPVNNRLGWRIGVGVDTQWLIPSEVWRTEVCAGLDAKFVAKALGERGMLEKAGDGRQPTRRISGRVHRVYVVLATIFEGLDRGA
jgi:putative DNA primase/helicase